MTQMLLFDPPAVTTFPTKVDVVPSASDAAITDVPDSVSQSVQQGADRGGMHRMGDLARLVLLRYELVAQRRAALAAKRKSLES